MTSYTKWGSALLYRQQQHFLSAKKTDHIGKSQVSVLANLNCVGVFRNQEVALQSMMTSHCGVGRLAANQGLMSQSRTKDLAKAPKYS